VRIPGKIPCCDRVSMFKTEVAKQNDHEKVPKEEGINELEAR
jgi:hypothetical protein